MGIELEFLETINRKIKSKKTSLTIDYFREQYDVFSEIIDRYKKNKWLNGTAYGNIAELAKQKGYTKKDGQTLSISQVCRYMNIIRAERMAELKKEKAELKSTKNKSKAVETQAVSVPGANKSAPAGRVAVDDSDAIPEKITGYDALKKLQEWERVKAIMSDDSYQWDDADETLYGQLRRYVFRFGEPVAGQGIIDVCRKKFPNQTGFPNSLAQSVEKLFNKREQHKGLAHWTM